jgi:hypothetical protein
MVNPVVEVVEVLEELALVLLVVLAFNFQEHLEIRYQLLVFLVQVVENTG